jgi:hypothetical protein
MFSDVRFGVPDFDSGKGYLQSNPVDLNRPARQLLADHPMPAPPSLPAPPPGQPDASPAVTLESLHVEVFSAARNMSFRKLGQPTADSGFVQLEGLSPEMTVLVEGKPVSAQGKLALPEGKYEVRLVEKGAVLAKQTVDVKSMSTVAVTVSRQMP